jgi:hypothetical protein
LQYKVASHNGLNKSLLTSVHRTVTPHRALFIEVTMKKVAVFALLLAVFAPVAAAQTAQPAANFTGKWEGTFKVLRPDGTQGDPKPAVFNLTQKGKALTGTGGPADQQWPIARGIVTAGKATFEMQQPGGPLFKFTLTIVKGRLQGDMAGEVDGVVRAHANVDAAKAK